jgi:hypothetical protein
MRLGFQHYDGTVAGINGATIKLDFAQRAAVGTGQLLRNVGNGFPHHALLNAGAQGASDGMSRGFDLAEVNGSASPPFGGLEVGCRFRRLSHQSVQFLFEGLDFVVHDQCSVFRALGDRFPARLHASHFNRNIANSPIDLSVPFEARAKADMHPSAGFLKNRPGHSCKKR